MQLTKRIVFRLIHFVAVLMVTVSFLISVPVVAQNIQPDSSEKIMQASLHRDKKQYFIKVSNVDFPDILKGNEEETLEYIKNFSSRRKAYLVRMYKKGKTLLPKTAAILKKYDLPEELKILLPLESAYNPYAVSKAGAVGYWQIMDEVAGEYGMKYAKQETVAEKRAHSLKHKRTKKMKAKGRQQDDRMNFNKSTITAARYLHARRRNLDDNWLLVVASYNCGVGNVWSAMERSGKNNPSFWDVKKYLPAETRTYVMNFITLNVIFANYENFIKNKLKFERVKVKLKDNEDNISAATVTSDLK